LFDLKALLGELEGGPPIRRSRPGGEGEPGATAEEAAAQEFAAKELPMPELGE
jgi:hypothetical protein